MTVQIIQTKLRGHGHRTIIITQHVANWFERVFLFAKRSMTISYCGSGSKWYHYPGMQPLKWKRLERELGDWEQKCKRQQIHKA